MQTVVARGPVSPLDPNTIFGSVSDFLIALENHINLTGPQTQASLTQLLDYIIAYRHQSHIGKFSENSEFLATLADLQPLLQAELERTEEVNGVISEITARVRENKSHISTKTLRGRTTKFEKVPDLFRPKAEFNRDLMQFKADLKKTINRGDWTRISGLLKKLKKRLIVGLEQPDSLKNHEMWAKTNPADYRKTMLLIDRLALQNQLSATNVPLAIKRAIRRMPNLLNFAIHKKLETPEDFNRYFKQGRPFSKRNNVNFANKLTEFNEKISKNIGPKGAKTVNNILVKFVLSQLTQELNYSPSALAEET